ncbi:DNA ligase [bioreactor metagenome]|uniref:DNA ligase (NAD(+)) n=1 Tax=bioreactor metagenome TaxID=1076179 RepID=A0A644YLX3_9ZZZZ
MDIFKRMNELIAQITEADIAYYKHDAPILSDRDYDVRYDELLRLEQESGIILSGSPTQRVPGEGLEGLTEVVHTKPMLSAGKTKSTEDIVKFIGGRSAILSWKLDGLTLVLRYENGALQQAITRGTDGRVGEDVTHTVKVMLNVPLRIPYTEPLEVRGEGVVSWANFNKLNETLEDPYSHPRNLAAGSIRKLDAEAVRGRYLEFLAFELIGEAIDWPIKNGQLQFLKTQGFSVVPYTRINGGSSKEQVLSLIKMADPAQFPYPVDGLIFEYDDVEYGQSLGATGHHENRLMALKWQDTLYPTVFRGLELATTRTGMVSLTGVFDDVEIDGTIVNHAYLHNVDIFTNLALGAGDQIEIYKANMIIPQIAENHTKSGTFPLPTECPCCGGALEMRTTSGGTRQLFCENPACPAKLVRKFVHFCSKTRMDIEGLSETTLEKFIQHGWIKTFGDLYELEKHRAQFVSTPGFGEKSFARLQAAVDKRRACTLKQFIAGLGIPEVGRHAGAALCDYFHGSWAAFEQAIKGHFDFTQLADFGQIMNDNIYTWYADTEAAQLWRPVLDHITFLEETKTMSTNTNNPFAGKSVVATGKLENYTRSGIQDRLLELGAKPSESVSKKTDYLIVGENAGSKLDKAHTLGVKTLTEQEFEVLAGQASA